MRRQNWSSSRLLIPTRPPFCTTSLIVWGACIAGAAGDGRARRHQRIQPERVLPEPAGPLLPRRDALDRASGKPQNFTGFDEATICELAELDAPTRGSSGPLPHHQLRAEPRRIQRPGAAHAAQRVVHADARSIAAAATSRGTSRARRSELGYVPTPALRRRVRAADAGPGDLRVGCGRQPEHGLSHVAGRGVPADGVQRAARLVVSQPDRNGGERSVAALQPALSVRGAVRRRGRQVASS